jgi:hypothetical protein
MQRKEFSVNRLASEALEEEKIDNNSLFGRVHSML